MTDQVERLCTLLLAGATRVRLYGTDHPLSQQACGELFEVIQELHQTHGTLRVEIRGAELHCAGKRFDARSGSVYGLVRRLSASGVGSMEFQPGLFPRELTDFCAQLADPLSRTVRSSTHISLASAEFSAVQPDTPIESVRVRNQNGQRNDPLTVEAKHLVALHEKLREHHEVRTRDFRDIVLSLMSRFSQEDNVFFNLAEVRDHNLFTYLHTCNVATLSIGFSLGMGIAPNQAFDIGVAALLHDVGKSFVPTEILDKPGRLTDEEWEIVKTHPVEGARLLLKQPTVNHLAVVVAYEHHMHFNGYGGYPASTKGPSPPSQLIAITDTYDALFGNRSYHDRYDVVEALEILACDSGSIYSPELVDRFTLFVNTNLDGIQQEGLRAS